jgi:ubiquinol-cytochrome c reductase cytochrome c subunit
LTAAPFLVLPLAALIVLTAGAGRAPRAAAAHARTAVVGAADIRTVYLRDCAVCHGADGTGTARGPSLAHVGTAALDFWISTGRMPLSSPDAQPERKAPAYPRSVIDGLVRYVHALTGGGGTPIPMIATAHANVANGGDLFRLNCAACHSWAGDGGALPERAAPPTHAATQTQIAEAIRTGPGRMPAFGTAALDQRQLDAVVAYTRYLDHPSDRGGFDLGHLGPLAEGAVAVLIGLGLLIVGIRWIGTRQ